MACFFYMSEKINQNMFRLFIKVNCNLYHLFYVKAIYCFILMNFNKYIIFYFLNSIISNISLNLLII